MHAQGTDTAPKETQVKLAAARQLNFALSALGIAAALGFALGGAKLHLPCAFVLALLPPVLFYLVHREPLLYGFAKPRNDPRTDVSIAFMACAVGLIVGITDVHFIGSEMLLERAGLVGVMCCAGIFAAARRHPQFWSVMFATLFVGGMYGWGLTGAADSLPDRSAPKFYMAEVADRYEAHHRGTSYHLVLDPWGSMQEPTDVTVSHSTYESTAVGGQVCVALHPGLLYLPWYQIIDCSGTGH